MISYEKRKILSEILNTLDRLSNKINQLINYIDEREDFDNLPPSRF